MIDVAQADEFSKWLKRLKDPVARAHPRENPASVADRESRRCKTRRRRRLRDAHRPWTGLPHLLRSKRQRVDPGPRRRRQILAAKRHRKGEEAESGI